MDSPGRILRVLGATILSTTFVACTPSNDHRAPLVRIVATDSGFVMPAHLASGITEVRLFNAGTTTHEGVFSHFLTPDATGAAYAESVRAGDEVPTFEEDVGGPGQALPGDSTTVWMDLTPGHYAVACWYAGHMEHGGFHDFDVVTSHSIAQPPSTDLTVRMFDFAYQFEGRWTAGTHRVLVENAGTEIHEFDPYRLEPGKQPQDFFHWIETHRHGPSPAIPLGGSGTFPPGHRIWLPLRLTPGRYFCFCQMPAKIGGKPHYQIGMVREFEVK